MDLTHAKAPNILLAEDDVQDQLLVKKAFERVRVLNELRIVDNGVELLAYLRREPAYADEKAYPWPGLILLDLNMPEMDGREALRQIRADPDLKTLPVIVLTTSRAEVDIVRSYCDGANSFVTKPVTFDKLVEKLAFIGRYWAGIVELPPNARR